MCDKILEKYFIILLWFCLRILLTLFQHCTFILFYVNHIYLYFANPKISFFLSRVPIHVYVLLFSILRSKTNDGNIFPTFGILFQFYIISSLSFFSFLCFMFFFWFFFFYWWWAWFFYEIFYSYEKRIIQHIFYVAFILLLLVFAT